MEEEEEEEEEEEKHARLRILFKVHGWRLHL